MKMIIDALSEAMRRRPGDAWERLTGWMLVVFAVAVCGIMLYAWWVG